MGKTMGRTVAIGLQDFGDVIRKNCFYVDKTEFIREWWESEDSVTLITRPRRFGKTLNMSMLERLHCVKATTKGLIEPNPSVCFYHGFVLGLMVDLQNRYVITSNRESGFGRYDVMLEPKNPGKDNPLSWNLRCMTWKTRKR